MADSCGLGWRLNRNSHYIRQKEFSSKFLKEIDHPYDKEDWYGLLFNRMISSCNSPDSYKNFQNNKVAFVTFNYDRSLEYFLCKSFCHTFWESRNNFEFSLDKYIPFPIIHVYGQVTPFERSSECFINNVTDDYREDVLSYKIVEELSKGVLIVGERTQEDLVLKVKDLNAYCERIFFLGFGYAKENLEAIGFLKNIDEIIQVFGTAIGMTQKEIQDIKNIFPVIRGQAIHQPGDKIETTVEYAKIEDKNSYELLRAHL